MLILLFLFCLSCTKEPNRKVLLVSIDGLHPLLFTDEIFHTPTLKRLYQLELSAHSLTPVFPSVTYPNHTSMITGVLPRTHGIISNTEYHQSKGPLTKWYWEAEKIKAPTLWTLAAKQNLKTAAIHWPVTLGAKVDYLIPEIFPLAPWYEGNAWDLVNKHATKKLIKSLHVSIAPYKDQREADLWASEATVKVLKKYSPDLTLLHLTNLDHAQHISGRNSKETQKAAKEIDQLISQLISSLPLDTCMMIVGDHGFLNYNKIIHLNALFFQQGWITLDSEGLLKDYQVIAHKSGAQAAIYLKDQGLKEKVLKLLSSKQSLGYHLILSDQLSELGAYPDALAAVSALDGYSIGGHLKGAVLEKLPQTFGQHGHLPNLANIHSSLLTYNCYKQNLKLKNVHNLQIAPSIAKILGIRYDFPQKGFK